MDIYENVVIGNFLYGLGFEIGAGSRGKPHAMSVNLLQQTPQDKPLGDVLIKGASVFRLIEFKRLRNDSYKERTKHWHIRETLKELNYLTELAMRCHWYVETEFTDKFHSHVRPYLHLLDRSRNDTLEIFIRDTARQALAEPASDDEEDLFREYIDHLLRITEYSGEGTGALIFTSDGSGGVPKFAAIRDIRDLGRIDRDVMNDYWQADMARQHEVETPRQQLTQTRSRGRSWKLSREADYEIDWDD